MLLLRLNAGESVVLFDPDGSRLATVMITEIEGNKATLGFLAPPKIRIVRSELLLNGVKDGHRK